MSDFIYGKNPVKEKLRSDKKLDGTLFIASGLNKNDSREIIEKAKDKGLQVVTVSRRELEKKTSGKNHQGLLLDLKRANENRIVVDWKNDLDKAIKSGNNPRVAILDRVQDPHNLGAIVRSAAQFGISHVFILDKNAAPFNSSASKSACGGEEYCHVVEVGNLVRLIETLKGLGFWIAAAVASGDKKLWDAEFNEPFAVILGSEGDGVRRLVLENSDYTISIPTLGKIDSLNVSVSASLVFYEIFRRDSAVK